jgi:predicted acyltransferase
MKPELQTGLKARAGGVPPASRVAHPPSTPAATRVASVDAYRGLVMFLMMAEVLELKKVAEALPGNAAWRFLAFHQTHAEWAGCSLHDLIQPSFSFLVGVAVPFSLAGRVARGQKTWAMLLHAAWRSLLLIALGIFLRSIGKPQTRFTFEDTLSQIGLGYFFLFLLGFVRQRWQWVAFAALLVGYWAAFALYPVPGEDFNYGAVGLTGPWPYDPATFAAHWNKNTNLAWAFDRWFLNLFPPPGWFAFNGGGYATLSFVPTLATMVLGLIAGGWLRGAATGEYKAVLLAVAGAASLAAGFAADYFGVCPSVKRIWTPAWVLFSGGWCFLLLAGFYAVMDLARLQTWAFPLRVIGANSIAAYVMAHLIDPKFIAGSFRTHLGQGVFETWGAAYEPFAVGLAVLAVYWLILFWMYRRRIFLRI